MLLSLFFVFFDCIRSVRFDKALPDCMRFLSFCYCKINATGCFQS